ncbi:MAG TPA: cyclic nucleotide-binding domain-containing protein [Ktedonobacterales bacterium]|jgi:CRP-like cAMP-binding protein
MQTIEQELAHHPFFDGLDPRFVGLIAGCGSNVQFEQDADIFREGEPADRFYVIRHGRVALETAAPHSGRLVIETIEAGEVLGWSWLFPPYRWHFSGRALEPVRAVALDGACLREKCERDHDLGYAMMQRFAAIIVERLHATRLQLLDLYASPAQGGKGGVR